MIIGRSHALNNKCVGQNKQSNAEKERKRKQSPHRMIQEKKLFTLAYRFLAALIAPFHSSLSLYDFLR